MTQAEAERLLESMELLETNREEYKKLVARLRTRIDELEDEKNTLLSVQTQLRRRNALLIEHMCCQGRPHMQQDLGDAMADDEVLG